MVDERVCWPLVEFDGGVSHVSHYLDLTIGLVGCVALQNGGHQGLSANFHGPMEYMDEGSESQRKETNLTNSYLQVDFSCMPNPRKLRCPLKRDHF